MENGNMFITISFLVVYFLVIIGAAFFTKAGKMKQQNMEEYAVGGRSFGSIVVVFMVMGVFITASVFTSFFSMAGTTGMFAQYVMVYGSLCFMLTYVFSKRIWVWGKKHKLLTQPDFIQLRYNCKPLTLLFSAISILLEFPWVVMEFVAIGLMVNSLSYGSIPPNIGVVVVGVIVISYMIYGGMRSIAVTELIQGILSSVVIGLGMILVVYKLFGGYGPMFQQIMEVAPQNLTINNGGNMSYFYWASVVTTGSVGIMGWCTFFTRIYTSKNVMECKKMATMSTCISAFFCFSMFVTGMCCVLKADWLEAANAQTAFYAILSSAFGPIALALGGVVIMAAAMSMISIACNTMGIVIAENFVKPFRKKQLSGEQENIQRVKIARICVIILSVAAVLLSMLDLPKMYAIAIAVYDCMAQAVPLIIFSLYWRRSNKYGAILGFIVGMVMTVVLNETGLCGAFTGGFIALIFNVIVHFVCGFIFPKDPHVDELFDQIEKYEDDMYDDAEELKLEEA